jgi:MOSC domain-containing protein YiiM
MPSTPTTTLASTPTQVGSVTSVNISERKGTRKTPVEGGIIHIELNFGVDADAHAGDWHRQVSFLAEESIAKARELGLDVKPGDFAENITTSGIDLPAIPIGSILRIGDTEVEISQIGKVCHTRCAIYYLAGDCIFPREGIFSVVRKPGQIKVGDTIEIIKLGDGTCAATPPEALAEVEAARTAGTL